MSKRAAASSLNPVEKKKNPSSKSPAFSGGAEDKMADGGIVDGHKMKNKEANTVVASESLPADDFDCRMEQQGVNKRLQMSVIAG